MRVRVGTSGYSYKEWKGSFYPADISAARMLAHYAGRLDTVEINNTFYRMPSEKLLLGWAEQVPETFSFVLKASRRITHQKRLKDAGDEMAYLLGTSSVMGRRLGPLLFQLPPNMKKDASRLDEFLDLVPEDGRAAFEFRNASWFDEEIYDRLRRRNLALVTADTDGGDTPEVVPTADYGYFRLRRPNYDDDALATWADTVGRQPWNEAHVFFKHEDEGAGPAFAARFSQMIRERIDGASR